ncbi:uncharacterized protein LOC133668629 [Populus nigra]|uniref:uncharacterized protein LOC133668629 n=1 Tax=Populus nigra TaxID=3691 RepID=UPI002B276D2C|nr:uncharacterized protein LOC133668629 [Populus nigra]
MAGFKVAAEVMRSASPVDCATVLASWSPKKVHLNRYRTQPVVLFISSTETAQSLSEPIYVMVSRSGRHLDPKGAIQHIAIYKIEKVLLPKDIFASNAPAPAPVAPAPEKPAKAVPAANVESSVAPVDISSAVWFMHNNVVGSVGIVAAAVFAL